MAEDFRVSPTFLSQLENGKANPSVATLYSLARALDVDMDSLLSPAQIDKSEVEPNSLVTLGVKEQLKDMAQMATESVARISTTDAGNRRILTLDSGVRWESLASVTESGGHFVEIVYEPGAQTSKDGKTITHEGYEYGYALEGDLEMTIGDFVFTLTKGHSFGFDSSIPHIFRNRSNLDFRGVWFVHDCKGRSR